MQNNIRYNSILLLLLLFSSFVCSQKSFNFRNSKPSKIYTTKDGLLSNSFYGLVQDSKNYLYFYSNKGINKFDGHNFRRFTIKDGLRSNDVWLLSVDLADRIWIHSHDNALSYIENDSIYSIINFNRKVAIKFFNFIKVDTIEAYSENEKFILTKVDKIWKIEKDTVNKPLMFQDFKFKNYDINFDKGMSGFQEFFKVLNVLDNRTNVKWKFELSKNGIWRTPIFIKNKLQISSTENLISFEVDKNKYEIYNLDTLYSINRSFIDSESNLWVCTKNEGVLFYNILDNSSNSTSLKGTKIINFFSNGIDGFFLIDSKSKIYYYSYNSGDIKYSFLLNGCRLIYPWFDDKNIAYGDFEIVTIDDENNNWKIEKHLNVSMFRNFSVPLIAYKLSNDNLIGFTSSNQAWVIKDSLGFYSGDLVFNSANRFLEYFKTDSMIYLLTNSDIYLLDEKFNLIKEINRNQISTQISFDKFWIDCISKKLIIYSIGEGLFTLDRKLNIKKIISDNKFTIKNIICRNDQLVMHTDRGICIGNILNDSFYISNLYTYELGVLPENILGIANNKSEILVVSEGGIHRINSNFKKNLIYNLSIFDIKINDNRIFNKDNNLEFTYSKNNKISVSVSLLSYTFKDYIKYEYKLSESAKWSELNNNLLELQGLQPGNYNIAIKAINKYSGEEFASNVLNIVVNKLWYQTNLFLILLNLLILSVIFYLYKYFDNKRKRIEDNIKSLEYSLRESKIKVLENQMNPHFLFNSLTSIKAFIKDNDIKNADYYLGYFSKLMRLYLDSSRSSRISIRDEVELVKHYLILERMRFEERFDFNIYVNPELDVENLMIPTMMIQPIVENSVRHGLFNRKSGGQLNLFLNSENRDVIIEINDNGVGIARSLELKSEADRSHQSHATRIIKEKIELLNNTMDYQIVINTSELSPDDLEFKGTRTIIKLLKLIE